MRLPIPLFALLAGALALSTISPPASAQSLADAEYAVGPILTTTGVGVSGLARLSPRWSASLDLSLLPLPAIGTTYGGEDVSMSSAVRSAVLMGHYHPTEGALALGVGLYLGGHSFDFDGTPSTAPEVNGTPYTVEEIGSFEGEFTFMDGPALLLSISTRSEGYVTGLGLGIPSGSKVQLGATGSLATDPDTPRAERFRQDAAAEVQNIRDFADAWPVVVYLRFGYLFGL